MKYYKLLLLLCFVVSGCYDKVGMFETTGRYYIANDTPDVIEVTYSFWDSSWKTNTRTLESGGKTCIMEVQWHSNWRSDYQVFHDEVIAGNSSITITNKHNNQDYSWLLENADIEPGNFFNLDSWEFLEENIDGEKYVEKTWVFHVH